jgi:hypothetical protein
MKRSTMIAALATMVVLIAAVVASAQMMNMMGNNSADQDKAAGNDTGLTGVMQNMSAQHMMMSQSFGKLEDHFNSMMKINNMAELKKEMQKHHDMMASMRDQMSQNWQTCSQMMSMMGSGGMQGNMMNSGGMQGHMMGQSSGGSSATDDEGQGR